ncbi:hypothetical protein HZS_742 [Henneguya salminicola]|nr:hypothetical protein HZS_742 [Henneguya salminicola]
MSSFIAIWDIRERFQSTVVNFYASRGGEKYYCLNLMVCKNYNLLMRDQCMLRKVHLFRNVTSLNGKKSVHIKNQTINFLSTLRSVYLPGVLQAEIQVYHWLFQVL